MTAKHTPGPWRIATVETGIVETDPNANGIRGWIALAMTRTSAKDQNANARLIAAAPDLLAALRGVLRIADRKTDEFDAARTAIAKALGESA